MRSVVGNWRTCESCPTGPPRVVLLTERPWLALLRDEAQAKGGAGALHAILIVRVGTQETVQKGSAGEVRAWGDVHGGVRDVVAQAQFVGRGADRHVVDDAADEAGVNGGGQRDVLAGLEVPE